MQPKRIRFYSVLGFILFPFLPFTLSSQTAQAQAQPPAGAVGAAPSVALAAIPAVVPHAAVPANPTISITASQRVIQPLGGKLPTSTNLAVFEGDCDSSKGVSLSPSYTLMVTGSGLSITQQKSDKCIITANITIDPNTPPGPHPVILLDGSGAPVAATDLTVMDTSAGAIPPGLPPEVDVMWGVMSDNNCADVFGTRVASSLYCIQLKIGNNAGHPLQLAGIGFTNQLKDLVALGGPYVTLANSSYGSTRAILLHQEMWNPRNVLYHSLEGAGLIMAGAIPFFVRPNAKAHFATFASIVSGPLLQAFNLISPDPILSQLNNLDDQSFRDNIVIPNNAQIQTIVFVEKQALTTSLLNLRIQLSNAAADSRRIAGTESQTEADVLKDLANHTAVSVKNSKRPVLLKGKQDPMLVKLALGSVVIVGQTIEYLQRVQIQSNATPVAGVPAATSVTPSTIPADGSAVALTVSGSLLQGATVSGPTGFTISNAKPSADGTSITLSLAVASSVRPGNYSLTITTSGGPTAIAIVVVPAAPTNPSAKAGKLQVELTWDPNPAMPGYNVYRGTATGNESLYKSGQTSPFTDSGLDSTKTYYYELTAVSAFGESPKSAEVHAQPTN